MFQSNYRYFYQTPLYDVSQIRITFTDKRINQPGGGASSGHKIKQYYEVSVARLVLLWKCAQLSKGAYMLHKNNFAHGSFPIDVLKVQKSSIYYLFSTSNMWCATDMGKRAKR